MTIHTSGIRTAHRTVRDPRLFEIAFGTFLLGFLFLCDILSTEYILFLGGHELNQFMAFFVADPVLHGMVKFFVLCFIALAAICCNRAVTGSGSYLLVLVIFLYSGVLFFNLRMIVQMMLFGSAG
ncbi:MAG: DUF5658 family protein [Methanoregula sp.]|jgi:hypothetical protein|uniref:DUF5658 family protein n=1 Tax=Methanoregula sp. TaxID=2052170 RepID=UPI0025F87EA9|nr:DUF5658 family protein [Methanoregula sp.]MCK9630437.1 DUF5658 family protein [Methanoregula sp.]